MLHLNWADPPYLPYNLAHFTNETTFLISVLLIRFTSKQTNKQKAQTAQCHNYFLEKLFQTYHKTYIASMHLKKHGCKIFIILVRNAIINDHILIIKS